MDKVEERSTQVLTASRSANQEIGLRHEALASNVADLDIIIPRHGGVKVSKFSGTNRG